MPPPPMLVMCDAAAPTPASFAQQLARTAGTRATTTAAVSSSTSSSTAKSKRKATLGRELEAREELQQEPGPGCCMDVSDRFDILDNLGGGAYGMVYRARDRERGGEIVALKKVAVREDPDIGIPPFVMREIANLNRLSATPNDRGEPNIVR